MQRFRPKGLASAMIMGLAIMTAPAYAQDDPITLTYVLNESISTIGDPVMGINFSEHKVAKAMFEPLLFDYNARTGERGLRPMLATSWELIDAHRWRFHLREGVTFHNGNPFNAAAVKFSIERVHAEDFPTGDKFKDVPISHVEIVDDLTVDIVTEQPVPILPYNLTRNGAFMLDPEHYGDLTQDEARWQPVGTGPYKLVEHRPDDRLILERHDDYWGWHPESNIEQLVMRFIPEVSTAASELIDGTVDIVRLSPDLAESVDAAEGVTVIIGESTNRAMVGFNEDMYPAMEDVRVRRALNLAIDRQGLVDALAFGRSELISVTAVNPPHDNPDLEPYPYDPEEARRLLAEAGYPDGFRIDTIDVMFPDSLQYSEIVAEYWRQIGIDVGEVRLLDWTVVRERWAARTLSVHTFSWAAPENTPLTDLWSVSDRRPTNSTHWYNQEFEDLYGQLMTEMDEEEAQRLSYRMQEILYEDPPWASLFLQPQVIGVRDRVAGYHPHPAFSQEDWASIYINGTN